MLLGIWQGPHFVISNIAASCCVTLSFQLKDFLSHSSQHGVRTECIQVCTSQVCGTLVCKFQKVNIFGELEPVTQMYRDTQQVDHDERGRKGHKGCRWGKGEEGSQRM